MKNWKKKGVKNDHHLLAKVRGGTKTPSNLLNMDIERHRAWHFLFHNATLDEVIALLKRLKQTQKRKGKNEK